MKTTVEIADPLFQLAKAVASEEGLTFRDLIEEGLRTVVAARKRLAAEPFRLQDGSFQEGGGLQPGVKWEELTALAYEEEGSALKR